jgi:hypothetical protein
MEEVQFVCHSIGRCGGTRNAPSTRGRIVDPEQRRLIASFHRVKSIVAGSSRGNVYWTDVSAISERKKVSSDLPSHFEISDK